MTDLATNKAVQIANVKIRIRNLRHGGTPEEDIPVALFREGWPTAAVRDAFEQLGKE